MRRATAVLANFYDPDLTGETRADALAEFVVALSDRPHWAVQRSFDIWMKTRTRRPSPGEISILVDRELEPIRRELEARARAKARPPERHDPPTEAERLEAQRLVARFADQRRLAALAKAPTARSVEEAIAASERPADLHWSQNPQRATPEALAALDVARAQNPIMAEMRAFAAASGQTPRNQMEN